MSAINNIKNQPAVVNDVIDMSSNESIVSNRAAFVDLQNQAPISIKSTANELLSETIGVKKRPLSTSEEEIGEENLSKCDLTTLNLASGGAASNRCELITSTSSVVIGSEDQQTFELKSHSSYLRDIIDIDENDEDSRLVSDYVNDIYEHLFKLESEQPIRKNYLEDHLVIRSKMRTTLIDWIYEVHVGYKLSTETFQLAVVIIDQYLQLVTDVLRSKLQLVGATALFLASKYEQMMTPSLDAYVYACDFQYDRNEVIQMEMKIFKALDFKLTRPLPINFLCRFLKAAGANELQGAMSKYFVDLTMIEYDMAHYKPSEISAAAVFLSLNILNGNYGWPNGFTDSYWTATLQWYSKYPVEHIKPIAEKIADLVRNAPIAELNAVYNNYKSSKFFNVSLLTLDMMR
uniref:Cyclin N-terminal domain-containing protein n=1 Tax=Glossina brevipalpis TaxID=37001 RepID=A0A1A9WDZ9_9MUSC